MVQSMMTKEGFPDLDDVSALLINCLYCVVFHCLEDSCCSFRVTISILMTSSISWSCGNWASLVMVCSMGIGLTLIIEMCYNGKRHKRYSPVTVCLSVCCLLSVCLFLCLSVVCLSVCLSVYPSVVLSVCLSVCLSIHIFFINEL